jgi:hypothetical protein
MSNEEIEALVSEYGEALRRLIVDALRFLDDREPVWGLKEPIDRKAYIADLFSRVKLPTLAERDHGTLGK